MIKKIISLLVISFFLIWNLQVNAEYTTTTNSHGFNDVVYFDDFWFEAKQDGNYVYLYWNKFDKEKLRWYKVMKSSTNENPTYPEQSAFKVLENNGITKEIDYHPEQWTNYYRVCAITYENNRYCSNVKKVYIEKEKEEIEHPTVCTMEYAPVCGYTNGDYKTYSNKCMLNADKAYYKYAWECKDYSDYDYKKEEEYKRKLEEKKQLEEKRKKEYEKKMKEKKKVYEKNTKYESKKSFSLKRKSQNLVNNLIKKLDKRDYSNDEKIEKIDIIINRLYTLWDKKPQLENLLNYLVELLKKKKSKYEDGFDEIEDIFSDF